MKRLSIDRLHELLFYNPETGVLTWRVDRPNQVRAGDRAGSENSPKNGSPYRVITIDGLDYTEHHIIFFYMTSQWPSHQIDHRDTNGTNNRWNNLREANHQENMRNRHRWAKHSTGFKGVSLRQPEKRLRPWCARIAVDKKSIFLGFFDSAEAAHAAYVAAAERFFGEFSRAH